MRGFTETDTTGMLSPNNGRLSGANKVCLEPTVWPDMQQCVLDSRVVGMGRAYLIEFVRDVTHLWDQRDKNYHNRGQKPKLLDEIGSKLNGRSKYW